MGEDELRLYRALSRAPFPKSYLGKVFLVAFLGTHVPLLALLAYLARFRRFGPRASPRRWAWPRQAAQQGPPHGPPHPQGRGGAPRRGRGPGRARRGDARAGAAGPRWAQ